MKLDLRKDARKIRRHIEKRIRDFRGGENLGPGDRAGPIALITLGYYVEQAGYFAMVIDTRPDADHDGQWTAHLENGVNVLAFPGWCAAFEALCDGGRVDVTLPDGATRVLDDSDDNASVARLFGETIRGIVLSLRDEGAFGDLPLAPGAFFVIEEFDGQWGWPDYRKRKTLGRLRNR